jgi:radical SAM superfamily enzyme YgiQ (UPF0313 family)
MRICLISPPTVTDFEDPAVAETDAIRLIAEHAPLGILSLAAVLDQLGTPPTVIDLNRLYYEFLRAEPANDGSFSSFVVDRFETMSFDLYGFSTICSSYPLTLRLARELRAANPRAAFVLGGPQASVVDVQTLEAYPFVDAVVRGEAEETLPALLENFSDPDSWDTIPGLTFRRGEQVVRTPNAPVIKDLDALPSPAFHLYPHLKDCRYVPLELGRGCPFACEFCSTNDFFRRRFRLKSPERVLADMRAIRDEYGIRTFDLVHDMFTVNRKKVVAFCETLLESGEEFYWNCSARTDCVDGELIALMAKAGCRGIFFGIETGSPRMQKLVNKNLDLDEARAMIRCADEHKIRTAVSVITAFPDETMEDVEQSIDFIVDSLRYDYAEPQLHLLAPLAETPIHSQYRSELFLDDIYSDMSYQGWRQDPADREMIAAHPEIFPNFYGVPTPALDRTYLKELREFVLNGIRRFRWLFVALHQESGNLTRVFDEWLQYRALVPHVELGPHYAARGVWDEFAAFLRSHYLPKRGSAALPIQALLDFDDAFAPLGEAAAGNGDGTPEEAPALLALDQPLGTESIPRAPADLLVAELPMHYQRLIECLRSKTAPSTLEWDSVKMAARRLEEGGTQFVQLSPLSARLLELCDGERTVDEVAALFAELDEELDGIPPEKACRFGLELLRQQGILVADAVSAVPS